ncbi:aldehyde dehydrogenase family protein [Pseudomonas citronellolis]|uniref:aldehyde dehydrogenase family protein n=1 Tax=Pseudomonas citronellolis TaxID=53408 RepID=UPI0023E40730|nr:aldehyde dehydrogenase family protein [Pseudomonas citronellolis]MDF3936616.1 aldehyde dehydrogenase family protein [Pseudomonas citronellolis]
MNPETSCDRLQRLLQLQKQAFLHDSYPSAETRIERMSQVPPMLYRYRHRILDALDADFGGHSRTQGELTEIIGMFDRARFNCEHVRHWMEPCQRSLDAASHGASRAYVEHAPKGVVGNLVAWNFPFDIGLGPTLDALGAGNRVIIKPSELTPACGQLLQEMIAETFAEDLVAVVNGDLELARHFPALPWDHLVYTGGARAAREVMKAAAEHLVPLTLELGGKCPAIVGADKVANAECIATIAGAKAIKRGQMCVSVDHCLVPEAGLEAFVEALTVHMQRTFATDQGRDHACGIIDARHQARLEHLLEDARQRGARIVRIGDAVASGSRHMPFHLVIEPNDDCAIMGEEIFGPLLPIKTYRSHADLLERLRGMEPPLGLYLFSDDDGFTRSIIRNTRSGGVALNAAVMQAALPSMGFGGVGPSGMGRHHGEEGFREFSNPRGFYQRLPGGTLELLTPPYGAGTRSLIEEHVYAPLARALGDAPE